MISYLGVQLIGGSFSTDISRGAVNDLVEYFHFIFAPFCSLQKLFVIKARFLFVKEIAISTTSASVRSNCFLPLFHHRSISAIFLEIIRELNFHLVPGQVDLVFLRIGFALGHADIFAYLLLCFESFLIRTTISRIRNKGHLSHL